MHTLGRLPFEILLLIIKHIAPEYSLYDCTLINKHFYTTINPLLWRTINIENTATAQKLVTCVISSKHLALGEYIRHVNLSGFEWTDNTLLQFMPRVPNLESFDLGNGSYISDIGFQQFAQRHSSNLTSLHLGWCTVTPAFIQALGQHGHQLRQLDVCSTRCYGLPTDTFSLLASSCPLEQLSFGMGSFSQWLDDMVDLTQLQHLTHLAVSSRPHLTMAVSQQPQQRFFTTPNIWPHLTHLTIDGFSDLTDTNLIAFLKLHPGLKQLELYEGELTDRSLETMSVLLSTGLVQVKLDGNDAITSNGVRQLILMCPELTTVDVFSCGLLASDFPEAGEHCRDVMRLSDYRAHLLRCLDQDAIKKIRLGPSPAAAAVENNN